MHRSRLEILRPSPIGIGLALTLSACAGGSPPSVAVEAEPEPIRAAPIPPVPRVIGRLAIRVVYPPPNAIIASRDSNFIFGSVGSGDAVLFINNVPVRVHPNGSFLGFLPLPARENPVYTLLAVRGRDTARVEHRVRLSAPPVDLTALGAPLADSESVQPRQVLMRRPEELVRLRIRVAPGTSAVLEGVESAVPFWFDSGSAARGDSAARVLEVPAEVAAAATRIVVRRGGDSLVLGVPPVALSDPADRALGVVGAAPSILPDTDRVVIARPLVGGTYKWFLLPGTVVPVTGRTANSVRIRLDRQLEVWVDSTEVRPLGPETLAPIRVAGNARTTSSNPEWSDLIIPVGERPPFSVETTPRGLTLTLYGTIANSDIINYAASDSLVERVTWFQEASDRARYDIDLREPAFGHLVLYERGALVLRIRRAPRVDPLRPLEGLTIAVDAGHPPAGSTGPTGLYEAVPTLAIAHRVRTALEQRGARVVLTRDGPSALGLVERPLTARRANAHAFVSIHLNALPDGVNPFRAQGTGSYYFTGQSLALARQIQRGMVQRLGLPDLGVNYDNLAVLRPTWMPAVLCEGAFIIIPEQEAALRTAEFQEAYALGVVEGLEAYFRELNRR